MRPSGLLQRLAAEPLRWRASSRRARGRYDRLTRRLFQRAERTGDPQALVDYLRFRRDLGHPLHPRFATALRHQIGALAPKRRWQAEALLAEIGGRLDAPGTALGIGISHAAPMQEAWRDDFRRALLSARSIAVVGNAGLLGGSGLGSVIDRADLVVRFNRWRGDSSRACDIGSRSTAWVTSPSYSGPRPEDADWTIVSGPDACYHLRNWAPFEPRLRAAQPVLTVPLRPWRRLVRTLDAPPSAGVLILAWLHDLLGAWDAVSTFGIGTGGSGPYHHSGSRLRPASRHAWTKEAALIEDWRAQGLGVVLPHESARSAMVS